jgi:PadR family transcriptional regulator, regulatory protein AphA
MEVLLGLLTIESMSGYDLGQTIRESIGHFWNESYGQIYPNLKKLAAEGFVTAKIERQKGKPDRHIYSITKKGRERLAKWLVVPPQPEIPRNEMLLKLFFGTQVSPDISIGYLERMAETERGLLEQFRQIHQAIARNQQYPDTPYWKMVARFGEIEMEAHLRWAEESLAQLKKIAGRHPSPAGTRKEKRHAGK